MWHIFHYFVYEAKPQLYKGHVIIYYKIGQNRMARACCLVVLTMIKKKLRFARSCSEKKAAVFGIYQNMTFTKSFIHNIEVKVANYHSTPSIL